MSDLTETERGQIIRLFKSGATKMSISETLGFPRATVIRKIQKFLGKKKSRNPITQYYPKLLNFEQNKY